MRISTRPISTPCCHTRASLLSDAPPAIFSHLPQPILTPPPPLSHTVRVSLTQMLHLWRAPGDSCRARTQPSAHARARAARARTRRREPCGAATGRLLSMRRLARGRPRDLSPWARPRFAPSRLLGKGRIPLLRRVQGGGADAAEWRCTRACRGGASHLLSHTCHAGCHTQHVTRRVSHAGCHTQHVTRSMPHAACHTQHVTRSMPHAGCHTQHVTHNVTHDVSQRFPGDFQEVHLRFSPNTHRRYLGASVRCSPSSRRRRNSPMTVGLLSMLRKRKTLARATPHMPHTHTPIVLICSRSPHPHLVPTLT